MVDLTKYNGDKFRLLEFLENIECYNNKQVFAKTSQDEMANALSISKHRVNSLINELILDGGVTAIDQKGKYHITKDGYYALETLGASKNMEKASHYKCASFFAGVGGIDLGFKQMGFETIYANEIDAKAIYTYEHNSDLKVDKRDIHDVVKEMDDGIDPFHGKNFDILLAGFPCQAFSIAGYREGFSDKKDRGNLFFQIMKIIIHKSPSIVFLENVKNLKNHDNKKTYQIIKEALESEGYYVVEDILNSSEYGNLPQNRERIYIVAFKNKNKKDLFRFPFPTELENNALASYIDFKHKVDSRYYYTDKFPHYSVIKNEIINSNTVYQWRRVYVRENKNNVCPTLTANMGTGGHNVPLVLASHGIRKLTPRECFALQGFPNTFKLPADMAICHLYKQAGNSVSVSVIKRIAREILRVL